MSSTEERTIAGQAVYTPRVLSIYDIVVLGISNRYVWKCTSRLIEAHYNENVSANHLDVGVGTGYFLDRCKFPSSEPRVGLMDMNANALVFTAQRIARYRPETYQQNVLEPLNGSAAPFDSIGINYLFHCVPGAISEKAIAFDYLKPIMKPGACVFGSTILYDGVPKSWAARKLMGFYNKKGIFANAEDDLRGLKSALSERFDSIKVEVEGCVALFSGVAR